MSKFYFISFLFLIACSANKKVSTTTTSSSTSSQKIKTIDDAGLPYYQLEEYSGKYSGEASVARMIDGLGFRFYWATEGLTAKDLSYKPSDGARTSEETIDHIMGLAIIIKNAVNKKDNLRSGEETSPISFTEKRKLTLTYLKEASGLLKSGKIKLEEGEIAFVSNDQKRSTYPMWNLINGPISDALWHVGQVVSFRRSSGNPFSKKVSVLSGKIR